MDIEKDLCCCLQNQFYLKIVSYDIYLTLCHQLKLCH